MKISHKTIISLILIIAISSGLLVSACAVSDSELESAMEKAAQQVYSATGTPQVGSIGGEWAILGLARSGYEVAQGYYDSYFSAVEKYVIACNGVLHEKKYTEYSRVILALTAIGADPSEVAGYNLLTPLGDFEKTVWQGINGPVWAIIALDSGNYDMPENPEAETQATRQMYIDDILSRQLPCGGWSLNEAGNPDDADPDVTGMALQALAGYQAQSAVKMATGRALEWLSAAQDESGGYSSWGAANTESVVQVIVALGELGISSADSRFVKNGNTLVDNLLMYQEADGSFRHNISDVSSSRMSSEQGLCALAAAHRATSGKSSLYKMGDVSIAFSTGGKAGEGLPEKHPDVRRVPVSAPGLSFADIAGHENQAAIDSLASREIISGMPDGRFAPDETMTRAQFSAIIVRALGLAPEAVAVFEDVPASAWHAPYIGAAYSYGLINGRGVGTFDPEGTITRQEAAVLVARAASLCGMDTELSEAEIRDILAQFDDYTGVAAWAAQSLAFCYAEDILSQSDMDIQPDEHILRGEVAQMAFNLLRSANLI